jgi:predicted NAD-dependent protein-ADP-ribosyltransferase YbiA (DUF1768 family)
MSFDRDMRKRLAGHSTAELVRATVAGELEWGDFLCDERPRLEISGFGSLIAELRANAQSPEFWRGLSLLSSWAPTPIVVDAELFSSVESFHHALKFPAGSEKRAQIAALDGPMAQHRARRRSATFLWRGEEIAVNSPEHAAVIALAVTEKVRRHANVAEVLRGTGRAQLTFGSYRNALAIGSPIAFMIERARLPR